MLQFMGLQRARHDLATEQQLGIMKSWDVIMRITYVKCSAQSGPWEIKRMPAPRSWYRSAWRQSQGPWIRPTGLLVSPGLPVASRNLHWLPRLSQPWASLLLEGST